MRHVCFGTVLPFGVECLTPAFLDDVSQTSTIAPGILDLQLMRSRSHDSTRADLSRPSRSVTQEGRDISHKGYVKFESALQPVHEGLPDLLKDPEKARTIKDLYLVTWLENDPEDPRNWSPVWRWCELLLFLQSGFIIHVLQ